MSHAHLAAVLAASVTASTVAGSSTFVVTTTGDVVDFGGAQRDTDLPGPDGTVSLREAVTAANNTPGPQTIGFDIPVSDPNFNGSTFEIRYGSSLILTDDATSPRPDRCRSGSRS